MQEVTAIDAMEALDRLKDECKKNGASDTELHQGDKADELEKLLARYIPNYQFNHDYILIKGFRRQGVTREELRHKQSLERLRELLPKLHCNEKYALALKLREMGMLIPNICEALGVSQNWYDRHCRPLAKKPERIVDMPTIILELEQKNE